MEEKEIFINHVINTIDHQMEDTNSEIITVQFSKNTYDGIRMYLREIVAQGRHFSLDIEEDLIPNTLLVIRF